MALVDDQIDGFSFIWTIQNFSYCLQKTGQSLNSPIFTVKSKNTERLFLVLLPRGSKDDGNVGIGLRKLDITKELRGQFVFTIRTVGGSYEQIFLTARSLLSKPGVIWNVCRKQEMIQKGTDNDTLTIRCQIKEMDDTILETEQCYARSIVKVERTIYTWNLKTLIEKVKELETIKHFNLTEMASFTMNVSMTEGIGSEDKFEVLIKRNNIDKLLYSTCALSLLNDGKVIHSVKQEHWFEISISGHFWKLIFAPNTSFQTDTKQCSTIYFCCEFVVSCGEGYRAIEKTVTGSTVDRPLVLSKPMYYNILGSWKENLQCFYSEQKLTDLTIRTPRKEFPVHKAMLCAQSPVFRAMFEQDMKENQTGIVEIEDLEDDTISMMLLFVYTCSIENLDCEKASKLYFAADKYEMAALKEKCLIFLKENLSYSNIYKLLILADMHQDLDLKSSVQNFIVADSKYIFGSKEWKEFMKEKVYLAAETMYVAVMQN